MYLLCVEIVEELLIIVEKDVPHLVHDC
jgi:hypothetical protein